MDYRELANGLLAELGELTGRTLKLDENDGCSFLFEGWVMNVMLLPKSGHLILMGVLGRMENDANAPRRARRLLEMHDAWQESKGLTFMLDPEARTVLAADRRAIESLDDANVLAAWIERFHDAAAFAWDELEFNYPYVDDDPLEDEKPLIREVTPAGDGKEAR